MSKYDFVLYAAQYEDFISKVRDLGLVDITTTGWEPNEQGRDLMLAIEGHAKAVAYLSEVDAAQAKPFGDGAQAYAEYQRLMAESADLKAEIAHFEKLESDLVAWGDFSVEALQKLSESGIVLRYFVTSETNFEDSVEQWGVDGYDVELIASVDGLSYFVVITRGADAEVLIDAQEVKTPEMTYTQAAKAAVAVQSKLDALADDFARCAASVSLIKQNSLKLTEQLQQLKVQDSAVNAADGSLMVMEAWAESSTAPEVEQMLEAYPNVVYFKSDPTPEDNTPVKLNNGFFAHTFEILTKLYALPKYGTLDLTPFFAPFYMLFFAICLCDAGYGLFILAAGLGLLIKGGDMRQAGWLTTLCGSAAVIFGFFANSFFGMEISGFSPFEHFTFLDFQKDFFSISLIIGFVQIMIAMVINIYLLSKMYGFRYSLGALGWFLLLFMSAVFGGLSYFGIEGFGFDSIGYYAVVGVSVALMMLFNSPGKGLFANLGNGLWNTYNNITGFMGDILSYIRLFAIGLSGGVLAMVFNKLAMGITGLEAGIEGLSIGAIIGKVIGAVLILFLGHFINLFMSTISSVVHPMRLTYVEFFKNAGFEMSTRDFEPLKNETIK